MFVHFLLCSLSCFALTPEYCEPLLPDEVLPPLYEEPQFDDDLEVDPPLDPYIPPEPPLDEPPPGTEQELSVNLKNPTFVQGVIKTTEGGVITGEDLRIQARSIIYTNKIENGIRVQKIDAEGDLMLDYAGRSFVGSRLEYDFVAKRGTLWEGKTFVDIWFLGGDRIDLKEDGTFFIYNAFVTTCESQENTWNINAQSVKITKDHLLSAKNIRFEFFRVPLLWLPAFKSNLKSIADSPIKYKVVWDKGLGPRLTMRYKFYSWRDINLFFRLDYRIKRGFGAALESEYYADEGRTTFVTRNYAANDKTFPDERGPNRYRIQGLYHKQSVDERSQIHITWDKLSDTRMVGDFKSDDFEINTEKRTRLLLTHQIDNAFFNCSVQPRINRFQSIDQELPLITIGARPLALGNSGIYFTNLFKASYLDYVYASDLDHRFHQLGLKSQTKSGRFETRNQFYRPFSLGPATLTPHLGILGIFYSNNPQKHGVGQGMLTYGAGAETSLLKRYKGFRHKVEPYAQFKGYTSPTVGLSDHYYFDIHDGYHQLNQLRVGIRNLFYARSQTYFLPTVSADLFTYAFFGNRSFGPTIPKYYLHTTWNRPFLSVYGNLCWNEEERLWDYTNFGADWTISEDLALGVEFRHRSRFDWRKGNHESFFLDVARSIDELLHSPLSDGRNTFLTRLFVRLAPKWNCMIQTRNGWGRKHEPSYNAGKIELTTLLSCSWRLKLGYERMPNDNRFTGSINLVK
ncbi:MAG: LPS-assembly protein LptD [Verrucomicrobia bacterium]|nr:LPS-assembly protein LptD [Verrucomicrobiota bacterium]